MFQIVDFEDSSQGTVQGKLPDAQHMAYARFEAKLNRISRQIDTAIIKTRSEKRRGFSQSQPG